MPLASIGQGLHAAAGGPRIDQRVADTHIKPFDAREPTGPNHDATEE
jgi:hypothetical protein